MLAPPAAAPAVDPAALRNANLVLTLGIVSVFFCAPLTAPVAIWLALKASHATLPLRRQVVGLVLACLGLVSSLAFWFFAVWQFLAPAPR